MINTIKVIPQILSGHVSALWKAIPMLFPSLHLKRPKESMVVSAALT